MHQKISETLLVKWFSSGLFEVTNAKATDDTYYDAEYFIK